MLLYLLACLSTKNGDQRPRLLHLIQVFLLLHIMYRIYAWFWNCNASSLMKDYINTVVLKSFHMRSKVPEKLEVLRELLDS